MAIERRQSEHGVDIALLGGAAVPFGRHRLVPRGADAGVITQGEIILRHRHALYGRLEIPDHRPPGVFVHAPAGTVEIAEIELGVGEALLRGLAIPGGRLGQVGLDADAALLVDHPDAELGARVALIGKRLPGGQGGDVVTGAKRLGAGGVIGARRLADRDQQNRRAEHENQAPTHAQYSTGRGSRLRHRYHVATERQGRQETAMLSISAEPSLPPPW